VPFPVKVVSDVVYNSWLHSALGMESMGLE
jgi:hypothetical protein